MGRASKLSSTVRALGVAVTALGVVACQGGGDANAPKAQAPKAAEAAKNTKPAAAAKPATEALPSLRIGFPPILEAGTIAKDMSPLSGYLKRTAKIDAVITVTSNYGELLNSLESKAVEVARLPAYLYLQSRARMGDKIELLGHTDTGSGKFYTGFIITKADSDLKELRDLTGKTFAFVDASSSSGYVFPRLLIKEKGLDPDAIFGKTFFAGSHDKVIEAVLTGQADAGAVWNAGYKAAPADKLAQLRVLGQTSLIPPDALVIRKDVAADVKKRLADALFGIKALPEAERKALADSMRVEGWSKGEDSTYAALREYLKKVDELPVAWPGDDEGGAGDVKPAAAPASQPAAPASQPK